MQVHVGRHTWSTLAPRILEKRAGRPWSDQAILSVVLHYSGANLAPELDLEEQGKMTLGESQV
jgi:hypothetical protein